ncbi:iron-containing redox enzyme family protein [Streptomyces sp. PKU-EA00015]|uniref:iron-containing redox enzyme family protein n=1 Tax=Streptomyces sp. PKU-EA00015 TaxID=2748326 RepID=UPI00183EE9ED|nr:iron-containing redox enzyme family protein [Streptomyces sp. PKU-EA00015]NWF25389.1 iron-containing redox enzyme family protein [Streptomyces sp. PKU-EA00015]
MQHAPTPLGRGTTERELPQARGDLSAAVLDALRTSPALARFPGAHEAEQADPLGDDLQLALYACYELHYLGFTGVDPAWEWDPELLRLRAAMEENFQCALRAGTTGHPDLDDALDALLVEPVRGTGVSRYLHDEGSLWQLREYAAQRSLYHLKEADPHAWVIPRLRGRAKAAFVAVEFDEFGGGRPERVHARLFADLMADLRLDTAYGRYADAASAQMLATVNLMSLLGLHRAHRGALVGHFAAVEITSSPASRRLAAAMRRTGAGSAAERFYDEHVIADAVHEQVVRRDVIGGLLEDEPSLAPEVAFGIAATEFVEDRFAEQLLGAWRQGATSLRTQV